MIDWQPGLHVRFWKPAHAEHGTRGVITGAVIPVLVRVAWERPSGPHLPELCEPGMIRTEADYQSARAGNPDAWHWVR